MIYIFDVDGTLTPSRQQMTQEMFEFMVSWGSDNIFYLCSGSDEDKIREQIPKELLNICNGIFPCMGNQFIKDNCEVYRRDFQSPEGLEEKLLEFLKESKFKERFGNHIEKRLGMWNFSVVGRNVDAKGRERYFKFDRDKKERTSYAKILNETFAGEIVASVGGEISIDIVNPGSDKSQVLPEIESIEGSDCPIIFVGDRTFAGGNDYELAQAVNGKKDSFSFQTESWQMTKKYLNFSN